MSDYVVWYTNFKTGEMLGTVPALSLAASSELNGTERISVILPMEFDPNIDTAVSTDTTTLHNLNNFTPSAVGVFIVRDGVILYGGLLWGLSNIDFSTETFGLDCLGFKSYLDRRVIRNTLAYANTDQNTIANGIVSDAVSGVAINTVSTTHGVTRDRTYIAGDRHNVGEKYHELSQVSGGFDYYFTHSRSSNNISSSLRTTYPAVGRSTNLLVEMDKCSSMTINIDGSEMVNFAEAINSVPGDFNTIELAINSPHTSVHPQLDAVDHYSDISERANLQNKAQRRIDQGSEPAMKVNATLNPDTEPAIGSFIMGDIVRLRAKHGAVDIDKQVRIVGHGLTVTPDGKETQSLSMVTSELFIQ